MISIDMVPDDVLLEVFDFYVAGDMYSKDKEAWRTLVHVCRRWRSIVFGSPRRLDLQLVCTYKTPVRNTLDVWPALPLVINDIGCQEEGMDNIIAFLKPSELVSRIRHIGLWEVPLEDILEAMKVPFPELTYLGLHHSHDEMGPVSLSDSFLGGSAPRLLYLDLYNISFPGLPKLLLSTTQLTDLHLSNIPHSAYISPEAIVACLSILTSLDGLSLEFQSPQSRPDRDRGRPPPLKRTVLPVLTYFQFRGVGEYLEDLVARLDAPQLDFLDITFFNDIIFDTPQFTRLISHTPTFEAFDEASVTLGYDIAGIKLSSTISDRVKLIVSISCRELDWQLSFLEQVCTSSLLPFFTLEDLFIFEHSGLQPVWEDNIGNALWLELLYPFTTVKDLFLSEKIAPRVVPALQELVGGRTTEVFPTLQNVFIEGLQQLGPVQEGIEKFVAARQVASHPIAVSRWDRDSNQPQVPHIHDLSSDARRINPEESAHLGLPSPVALAPQSGGLIAASEFPPEFMATFVASTRPAEIDLFMLPEEGPTMAQIGLDPALGSSADRPIELDLEGMDIDMTDVGVSLFGGEPPNDIPTANTFDSTTTTWGNNPSALSLLEAFHRATATDRDPQASVTALPFDMAIDMDNIDFSKFQLDSMMNTSDMGMIDMDELELLNMDPETGTQAEDQNAAGDT
jgi:hypothetical protein